MIPLRDSVKTGRFPIVNWAIIIGNIYVFYLELGAAHAHALESFIQTWAVIPSALFADPGGEWSKLVTATFLHGGWMHIGFNMLFLFIFGDNVEDRLGHFKYLFFYLMLGILANGTQAAVSAASAIPLVGASGAIAGILGSYFYFYPRARVLALIPIGIFIRIADVPAFLFLGLWFILQAFNGTMSISQQVVTGQVAGGVAWWAHASGFVFGLLLSPFTGAKRPVRY